MERVETLTKVLNELKLKFPMKVQNKKYNKNKTIK